MFKKSMSLFLIILLAVCMPLNAFAASSGAFNIFGSDAEALGKGNAFTGEADNPSAVHFNPAGLTQIKGENYVSVGTTVIKALVEHTSLSGSETQMRQNKVFVPSMYGVSDFNLDKFVFGVGVKTNYGAGTDWAQDSFSKFVATKTELVNIDYLLTGAYEVNDHLSFGIGLDIVDSKLSESKNLNQVAVGDAFAQLKVDDVGVGYSLSTLVKISDKHQFGIVYKSEVGLEYEGEVHLTGLSAGAVPTNLNALFGGSSFTTKTVGGLDLPQSVAVGYSFRPNEAWMVNLDFTWMDWSSISEHNFNFPNVTASQASVLNASTDFALDWTSTVSYGLGIDHKYSDVLNLRVGYSFNPTPIPEHNFNTFLPDADSHSISVGAGWEIREDVVLDIAYMGMLFKDREVRNSVGSSVVADIDGEYEEYVHVGLVTVTHKF